MTKKIFLYPIIAFILFLQGCLNSTGSDYQDQANEADEIINDYLSSNNIDAEKRSSGVYVEVLEENPEGKQVIEDHVVGILYTMINLDDENVIESHTDTLNPLRFSYSYDTGFTGLHPAGLTYEIGEMKKGEKFRFYIPFYRAFDNYSHDGLFESYSNFIIEVDLIELKTEDEIYEEELDTIKNYIESNEIDAEAYPNGLYYVSNEEGTGEEPSDNSQIEFHFTRKYLDGTIIETTQESDPIQVTLNGGKLVPGLENGIRLMKEGGKAELIMPSKLAFGKSVQVIPQQLREDWVEENNIEPLTKPYSSVIYEVELLDVVN